MYIKLELNLARAYSHELAYTGAPETGVITRIPHRTAMVGSSSKGTVSLEMQSKGTPGIYSLRGQYKCRIDLGSTFLADSL